MPCFQKDHTNFFSNFLLLTKTTPQEATKLFGQFESTVYKRKF